MPTYSYECTSCHHVLDVFHGMSEKRRVKCPDCGGTTKRLLGTGAGIIFKGSGFYQTDYKNKGDGKPANGKGEAKPDSSAKGSESKSESKSGSTSETKSTAKSDAKAN